MSPEEIEKRIQEILYGKAIVEIINEKGISCPFIIRALTGRENALVHYTHQQALSQGREAKLCTQLELERIFRDNGTWTNKDEEKIESLSTGIKRLKNILPDYEFQKAKYQSKSRARVRRDRSYKT
jgi:hypothetical protein